MTLNEAMREQYRQRRYLQGTSADELAQRFRDIVSNLVVLQDDGKLGVRQPLPVQSPGGFFWTCLTHCLEEYAIRGWDVPDIGRSLKGLEQQGRHVPRSTWPDAPRGAEVFARKRAEVGPLLAKYTKGRYVDSALRRGEIRISPASNYSDPSLNPAQRDGELKRVFIHPASDVELKVPARRGGPPTKPIKPIRDVEYHLTSKTNYYVYCLSTELDPRLLQDFDADGCLVVRDRRVFIERLLSAFERQMPGWCGMAQPVCYVDPYLSSSRDLDLFFTKPARYFYQGEFRFVWLPEDARQVLDPVLLTLGSLEDCCEALIP